MKFYSDFIANQYIINIVWFRYICSAFVIVAEPANLDTSKYGCLLYNLHIQLIKFPKHFYCISLPEQVDILLTRNQVLQVLYLV